MKYTWPTPEDPKHLHSTDWRWGLASGVMQILGLSSGVTQILALDNAKIYQHVGIFWRYLTPSPNASSFSSQWNTGLKNQAWVCHAEVLLAINTWLFQPLYVVIYWMHCIHFCIAVITLIVQKYAWGKHNYF